MGQVPQIVQRRRPAQALAVLRGASVVMGRTLFALILREARTRHGRSRIGYAWAVLEPIAIVAMISALFSGVIGNHAPSLDIGIFYALGVVQFQFFRHASHFVGLSIEGNTALLNYPTVHEVDTALARLLLDGATYVLITCGTLAFVILAFHTDGPAHPEWMFLSFGGLALLAFGIGLNLAAFQRRYEMAMHVWGLITTPLFFISALLFSLGALPTPLREILLWNPVAHGVEGFRSGWYPDYGAYVDLPYLYFCGLACTATGLIQVLGSRRGMR